MMKLEEIIEKIGELPPIPKVAQEVSRLLRDPSVTFKKISETIQHDPGLTANVLKIANSAAYGFSKRINSLQQAVVILGTNALNNMVLIAGLSDSLIRNVEGYDLPANVFWESSLANAVLSQKLAAHKKEMLCDPYTAFTAGLLLDSGKLVLGSFVKSYYSQILSRVENEGVPFDEAERRELGFSHADVGGLLLKNWKFPDDIVECVIYHHTPDLLDPSKTLVDVVHVANNLSMMRGTGMGKEGMSYHQSQKACERLKINLKDQEIVLAQAHGIIVQLVQNLNLKE